MNSKPLRVLYLHSTSALGGMTKSLSEMIRAFPQGEAEVTILCPKGSAAELFRSFGFRTIEASGIARCNESYHGHYHGLRWLVLLREMWHLPFTLLALFHAIKAGPYDIIHSNEIDTTYLGALAKYFMRKPLVIHVRCVLRGPNGPLTSRLQERFVAQHADTIIAIDQTVRRSLPLHTPVEVIHNGMSILAGIEEDVPSRDRPMRVAMVGMLMHTKGIYEFVEAAIRVLDAGVTAEFWIVGGNTGGTNGLKGWLLQLLGLRSDVRAEIETRIAMSRHGDKIRLMGAVLDIGNIYRQIDVLSFAGYYNAPGRPVFEAAYFGIPSIVAVRDPTPDTIVPGETGLCIQAPDPVLLAEAITYLHQNPEERRRMGENARALAQAKFDIRRNAARVLEIYRRLACKKL